MVIQRIEKDPTDQDSVLHINEIDLTFSGTKVLIIIRLSIESGKKVILKSKIGDKNIKKGDL